MKKLLITLAVMLASMTALKAQEPTQEEETIATFEVENSDDVTLSSKNDGNLSINIAGYSIALSENKGRGYDDRMFNITTCGIYTSKVVYEDPTSDVPVEKERRRGKVSIASNSRLGFIGLTKPDYSAYSVDQQGFLDLRLSKSIYFSYDIVGLCMPLNNSGTLALKTGLGASWYNFTFDNDISVSNQNGVITPYEISSSYKKSKLTAAYFTIPLSLSINLGDHFSLEPGVYAGILTNAYTKYKKPNVKSDYLKGLNQAMAGVSLTVSAFGASFYGNYNITSLFEEGRGPATQAFTVGLAFTL